VKGTIKIEKIEGGDGNLFPRPKKAHGRGGMKGGSLFKDPHLKQETTYVEKQATREKEGSKRKGEDKRGGNEESRTQGGTDPRPHSKKARSGGRVKISNQKKLPKKKKKVLKGGQIREAGGKTRDRKRRAVV